MEKPKPKKSSPHLEKEFPKLSNSIKVLEQILASRLLEDKMLKKQKFFREIYEVDQDGRIVGANKDSISEFLGLKIMYDFVKYLEIFMRISGIFDINIEERGKNIFVINYTYSKRYSS